MAVLVVLCFTILPIILGGALFGIGSKTCPNVWAHQSRYTVIMSAKANTTQNLDISSIAFSSEMRIRLSQDQLESFNPGNYSIQFFQKDSSLALFNEKSSMAQSFQLIDQKSMTVKSNQNVRFEVTPIRKKCARTSAGAIILIVFVIAGPPIIRGASGKNSVTPKK